MRADYVNPFIASLTRTFSTMLDCDVHRGRPRLANTSQTGHEISGVIEISGVVGLSGKAAGTVVVSLSREVALQAAAALLLVETSEIDENVIDAVGEITNVVAGAAKAELCEYELSMSLPSVILGLGHEIRFPSNVTPICVPFTCAWGSLSLEVGLAEMAVPAGV